MTYMSRCVHSPSNDAHIAVWTVKHTTITPALADDAGPSSPHFDYGVGSRGRKLGIRTPIRGFGDRHSTVELTPYNIIPTHYP